MSTTTPAPTTTPLPTTTLPPQTDVIENLAVAIAAKLGECVSVDGSGKWTGADRTASGVYRPTTYGTQRDPLDRELWLLQGGQDPEEEAAHFTYGETGGVRHVWQNFAVVAYAMPAELNSPATTIDTILNSLAAMVTKKLREPSSGGVVSAGWLAPYGGFDLQILLREKGLSTKDVDCVLVGFRVNVHMLEDDPDHFA